VITIATPILPARAITYTDSATLDAFAQNAVIVVNKGTGVTITLPESTSVMYPTGTIITLVQTGAGAITLAKTGSDTIVPATSNTTNAGDTLILTKTAATAWHCGVAVAA
jgi:hypothetical protein